MPLAVGLVLFLVLYRTSWGGVVAHLVVFLWCYLSGAVVLGRLLKFYWRWCGGLLQKRTEISNSRRVRGVRGLACSLTVRKGAK